ncbi:MAG TPA: nuclear transport factor 2 family protein [Polyangiaceae bacterium]|nr:nuclear transport factor 2 family protein [Polyangiaceae bacterium]
MSGYPREELEEMMRRWLAANARAEAEGDWKRHLGPMYTDDAEYRWNVGPNEAFEAIGKAQILDWALGEQMQGFETWRYPYGKVLIDETQGEIVAFWKQIAPAKRADGSDYEVAGVGGSHFRYAGDYKWSWQLDFFDFGNVMALFMELAADGKLEDTVKRKIQRVARGHGLAGHSKIRPGADSLLRKLEGGLAMARIVLLGR